MRLKQKLIIWWTVPWNPLKEMITITQAVTMLVYNWLAFSSSLPPLRPRWSLGREFIKPQIWLIVISRPLYLWSWLAAADGTLAEYKTHQCGGKTECRSKTDGKQGFRTPLHLALAPSTTPWHYIPDKVAQGWIRKIHPPSCQGKSKTHKE